MDSRKRHCLPSLKGVISPLIVSRIVPFDKAESLSAVRRRQEIISQ